MHRRLFCPILAAVVFTAAMLGGADRAGAAIRVTINDGTTDRVFYSSSSQAAAFVVTNIGGVDLVLHSTVSNFPGLEAGGTLTTSINLFDTGPTGPLPTFRFRTEVIGAVAGVPDGEVTGANRTAVEAAPLARFTAPSSAFLQVSSDVSGMSPPGQPSSGTVQNNTTVNGTVVNSLAVALNSPTDALITGAANNAPTGYTLSSEIVFAGGTSGASGIVISGVSSVSSLVPEPGSFVIWGLGAVGLIIASARCRRLGKPVA